MPTAQNHTNHTRIDPAYHFFLLPVSLLNIGFAIWLLIRAGGATRPVHIWLVVLSFAFFVAVNNLRTYAKKVQDRVIRLEERIRLAQLIPAEAASINTLTVPQLIALRFASDADVPRLALQAARERSSPKDIKASITQWRADDLRV